MTCPKCGGENVTISMEQVSSKTQKRGGGFGGHIKNLTCGITAVPTPASLTSYGRNIE